MSSVDRKTRSNVKIRTLHLLFVKGNVAPGSSSALQAGFGSRMAGGLGRSLARAINPSDSIWIVSTAWPFGTAILLSWRSWADVCSGTPSSRPA